MSSTMKYWFNGAPITESGASTGGVKYWFNGLPVVLQAPAEAASWYTVRYTRDVLVDLTGA